MRRLLHVILFGAMLGLLAVIAWQRPTAPPPPSPPDTRRDAGTATTAVAQPALAPPGNARAAAPGSETIETARLGDPEYQARVWRSRNTAVYLYSPQREAREIQWLAAICRAYGYGPWAVAPAYWIALESRVNEEKVARQADWEAEDRQAMDHVEEMLLQARIADSARRLNVGAWDPAFLAAIRQVRPRGSMMHHAIQFLADPVLRDAVTWDDLDGW